MSKFHAYLGQKAVDPVLVVPLTHLTLGLIPPAANAIKYIAEKITAILIAPGIVPNTKRQRPMR